MEWVEQMMRKKLQNQTRSWRDGGEGPRYRCSSSWLTILEETIPYLDCGELEKMGRGVEGRRVGWNSESASKNSRIMGWGL